MITLPLLVIVLAQTPTTANLPATGTALDVLRPKFRGGTGTSLLSFAAYASGRTSLGNAYLHFELPFARVQTDFGGTSSTLGNPYIGIEFGGETGLSGVAGARFPLASENESASFFGGYADLSRFDAFLPNTATFGGAVRYRVRNADGFTFDVGGGPTAWFATKGGGDAELVVQHHMSAGYRGAGLWFAAGFSGWTIVTEDAGGVGERTVNQLNASIGGARGQVRPALHLIVPIDDEYNASVGFVIGFGVAFVM